MKIGVDIRCLMRPPYAGVAFYTLNLLRAILEQDKKNQYYLYYNSAKPVSLPQFEQDNVTCVKTKYPNKLLNTSLGLFSWPRLDKLAGGMDVFFTPHLNFMGLSAGCRKILAVHDLSFIHFPEFFNLKMRAWHHFLNYKKNILSADKIVADSQNTKQDLVDHLKVQPEKIQVIYNGVEKRFCPIDDQAILEKTKSKYKLPNKFILFLGTVEPRKNVESIIEAFNKLNNHDYHLVLAGARGWKSESVYKLAAKNDRIKIIGYVDEVDKPALYGLARVLAYPSYYEGFGLPLLEAMACGCPVIGGHNSSQIEVVDKSGILVNPYNISELTNAMEQIIKDDSLYHHLKYAGQIRAKQFTWELAGQNFLNLLT